jgi:hypothetical protein
MRKLAKVQLVDTTGQSPAETANEVLSLWKPGGG